MRWAARRKVDAIGLTILPARGEGMTNTLAMVDSAMRQWQTAVQQMMEPRPLRWLSCRQTKSARALQVVPRT